MNEIFITIYPYIVALVGAVACAVGGWLIALLEKLKAKVQLETEKVRRDEKRSAEEHVVKHVETLAELAIMNRRKQGINPDLLEKIVVEDIYRCLNNKDLEILESSVHNVSMYFELIVTLKLG